MGTGCLLHYVTSSLRLGPVVRLIQDAVVVAFWPGHVSVLVKHAVILADTFAAYHTVPPGVPTRHL